MLQTRKKYGIFELKHFTVLIKYDSFQNKF